MTKNIITTALLGLGLSLTATAATLHPADQAFLDKAAQMTITQENWDSVEYVAATLPNAYKFTNHYRISRGVLGGKSNVLTAEEFKSNKQLDFNALKVEAMDGEMPLDMFLRDRLKNHSMVVLKGDQLVHEHYWNGMDEHSTHLDMSVTKSFTAMLAGIAAAEGKLDMSKPVTFYLPELKNTAWKDATVQEVADMRTSLKLMTSPHKTWDVRMTDSQNWHGDKNAEAYPNGIADYMPFVTDITEPMGTAYAYQCINTEVLGKVVERATGENLANLLEENIWTRIGAENDAFYMSDATGYPVASGGLNAATKDLARVGRMILNDGKNYVGEQVIPKAFIDALWAGNDEVKSAWLKGKESALAEGWYKDQFRILKVPGHTILAMVGIHGQVVAMDKESGTVIAMNGGYTQTETPRMAMMIFHKVIPTILDATAKQ
ncbi:serine hydrolase domain-containing protein [Photobacterium kagoshimensis]|uniref:serine hydrolase domain-containing protein n=1 Tax=Photobacterium kagoshimensis TaxID=2910242 RepID=UPI003D0EC01A